MIRVRAQITFSIIGLVSFLLASAGTVERLPPTCSNSQIPKIVNGDWACAADGGGGPDCIEVPLLNFCAGTTACTYLSDGCVSWSNMPQALTHYGSAVEVDMDLYTHARIKFQGREAAGQTGTVTVNLRDHTNGVSETTVTSSSFASGETCISRDSTTADLSGLTGNHVFTLEMSNSVAGTDDPAFSSISAVFCNGAF